MGCEPKASSWPFWRDKKGLEDALEDYYPALVATNPMISAALMQMKMAKNLIDAEMGRLAELEDDHD